MSVPIPGLKDMLELLDRWDAWKRIKSTPDRVDALERRVEELSRRLAAPTRAPGKECPYCGAHAMRLKSSQPDRTFGALGGMQETWACSDCGQEQRKLSDGT